MKNFGLNLALATLSSLSIVACGGGTSKVSLPGNNPPTGGVGGGNDNTTNPFAGLIVSEKDVETNFVLASVAQMAFENANNELSAAAASQKFSSFTAAARQSASAAVVSHTQAHKPTNANLTTSNTNTSPTEPTDRKTPTTTDTTPSLPGDGDDGDSDPELPTSLVLDVQASDAQNGTTRSLNAVLTVDLSTFAYTLNGTATVNILGQGTTNIDVYLSGSVTTNYDGLTTLGGNLLYAIELESGDVANALATVTFNVVGNGTVTIALSNGNGAVEITFTYQDGDAVGLVLDEDGDAVVLEIDQNGNATVIGSTSSAANLGL